MVLSAVRLILLLLQLFAAYRFMEQGNYCLQLNTTSDPSRFHWTVPIEWSHRWPWLNYMGHKTKPKVMALWKGLMEMREHWQGQEQEKLERKKKSEYIITCMILSNCKRKKRKLRKFVTERDTMNSRETCLEFSKYFVSSPGFSSSGNAMIQCRLVPKIVWNWTTRRCGSIWKEDDLTQLPYKDESFLLLK